MWQSVKRIPVRYPLSFGTVFAGFKAGLCDVAVQKLVEKEDTIHWRRTLAFTTFSALFCGTWQYFLFVKMMPRLCPGAEAFAAKPVREKLADKVGMRNVLIQNFVENGFNNPILYFPMFYTVKEACEKGAEWKMSGVMSTLRNNYVEDIVAMWKLWIPAQLFNFAFSPMWMRVPFVACVSFVWTGFLSVTRGKVELELDLEPAGMPSFEATQFAVAEVSDERRVAA